jgi:hypothetical protein
MMKYILKTEEVMMLVLALILNSFLSYPWWLYWALFLTPDISMIGYLINTRIGAFSYNLFHHKGFAILLYLAGIYFSIETLQFIGLLLFGHSSFDRIMDYGLKYSDSFQHTHLGWIGKNLAAKEKVLD